MGLGNDTMFVSFGQESQCMRVKSSDPLAVKLNYAGAEKCKIMQMN